MTAIKANAAEAVTLREFGASEVGGNEWNLGTIRLRKVRGYQGCVEWGWVGADSRWHYATLPGCLRMALEADIRAKILRTLDNLNRD